LCRITGLPAEMAQIPWDGPQVRIVEHQAHAPGHAALLIEERGVLVAGDMLSDVLIPLLDLNDTADPIEDYLAALRLLEGVAGDVDVLVPDWGALQPLLHPYLHWVQADGQVVRGRTNVKRQDGCQTTRWLSRDNSEQRGVPAVLTKDPTDMHLSCVDVETSIAR